MRSYDFTHPKGTKYTPDEIRQHRDRWYEKVAAGGGLAPVPEHVVVDKEVFRAFQELIPYYPTLDYLKGRNFAGFSFNERLSTRSSGMHIMLIASSTSFSIPSLKQRADNLSMLCVALTGSSL